MSEVREESSSTQDLYPVLLKLAGRLCLVVGGGAVALHKTRELLRCGATVSVVAPGWPADFGSFDGNPLVSRSTRPFAPLDLGGVHLVVAATDDPETQREVARAAEERGILCNVVDVPALCNFYVPATLRRGSLTVSVSTEGKYPLLAVALRDSLARTLGAHLGPALDRLAEGRGIVRARYPEDPSRRTRALKDLLTDAALTDLVEGRLEAFEAHYRSWNSTLSA